MANKLAACPLRVAFDLDPNYASLRRPSIAAVLGTIVHRTTEAAAKQRNWPDDQANRRALIEGLWAQRETEGRVALEKAWSPAVPPVLTDWPGYEMKRVRTVRRILRSLPAVSEDASAPGQPQRKNIVEERIDDDASGLFGWPDRVEVVGDSYRVVDLKTGSDQEEPTDSQRRQLILYAVLVQRKYRQWPVALEIQDIAGNRRQVAYRPLDAESALREVEDWVAEFNQAIIGGQFLSLGRPNPDHCRSCPYRVVCSSYWKSLASQWEHQSVLGRIISSRTLGQLTQLVIEIESPHDRHGQIIQVTGLEMEHAPDGSSIYASITDLSGSWQSENLHGRWSTLIRLWK
jgi:CRISPR/Cas system-associated exonuclease Cas4 (RecB family)